MKSKMADNNKVGKKNTHGYELITVIHHCYKKIEQNDNIDNAISSKHEHTPKSGKCFYSLQFETIQIDQTENCPK